MEEEKKNENAKLSSNNKKVIAIIFLTLILIALVRICIFVLKPTENKHNNTKIQNPTSTGNNKHTYTSYSYIPTEEFNKLNEYDNFATYCIGKTQIITSGISFKDKYTSDGIIINTKEDLEDYIDKCEGNGYYGVGNTIDDKFDVDWDNNSLIVLYYYNATSVAGVKVTGINRYENRVNIKLAISEGQTSGSGYIFIGDEEYYIGENAEMIFILTDKLKDNTKLNFEINRYSVELTSEEITLLYCDKPIIYIYPTEETKVNIKVEKPENLTHTYPKYNNGWEVIAKPNGDLTDIKTGRNLYSLYWEGINTVETDMNEGFIVKGEDTITFLEEKLEVLGLNEREANEFIIYWLPKLESNKYNFIRFQTQEEINNNMPLEITPKPDTVIRVLMEFKGLEEQIEVQEQRLETPERTGYTVVEWGGTEVK